MASDHDIAASLAQAARFLHEAQTLEESLQRIAEVTREAVPGFDEVGISTVDRSGRVETRAATGDLVWTLDGLQYDLGEGPCLDSLRQDRVVVAPRLRHDQRWPRYVPSAVRAGLQSQLAIRLHLDDSGVLGGLNLYSTSSPEIDPQAQGIAELFAAHAAIALGHATSRDQLNAALQTRKVIGQALGILMERYELTEDRAFQFLVRASSQANLKLRDVAQEIVDMRNQR